MSKVIGGLDPHAASASGQNVGKLNARNAAQAEKPQAEKKDKKAQPSTIVTLNQSNSPAADLYNATGVTSKKAVPPVQPPATPKAVTPTVSNRIDAGKADKPEKAEKPEKVDKADKADKTSKVEAAEPKKADKSEGIDAGTGPVVVDIQQSESGYNNKIYYSTDNFATKQLIGVDNNVASVNLGTFAPGTKLQFAIDNGQGNFFKAGAASQNADGIQHANITNNSDGVTIGFEDLLGGGDRDFNDAIIRVRTTSASAPEPATPPVIKDNRSGLGDGTNPGKGAGTENSPNQGTLNPGNGSTSGTSTSPTPLPKETKTAAVDKPSDNRSGLGDGTNPGNGSGTVNSPNQGTLNPGNEVGTPTGATTTGKKQAKADAADKSDNRSGLGDGTNPGQGAGRANAKNQGTLSPSQAAKKTSLVV